MWDPATVARLQRAVRDPADAEGQSPTRSSAAALTRRTSPTRCCAGCSSSSRRTTRSRSTRSSRLQDILKRFSTGGMSLGALSPEAHETLAIAMNRIGGMSNSGEGGEDRRRNTPDPNGDNRRSRIKPGRLRPLRRQRRLPLAGRPDPDQDLPGRQARRGRAASRPQGRHLHRRAPVRDPRRRADLSPAPPRHLLDRGPQAADLRPARRQPDGHRLGQARRRVRRRAPSPRASPRRGADHVVIAGHDGGTGASPLSSIQLAGVPWEIGLAETQQTLLRNGLRPRIVVQTDGQMRTGRDVVIGAMLGADEFGFSTAPLIATGCIMMRVCHLNTCPVGVATQDPELRARFAGTPEHVVNYLFLVAEDVRAIMASLGIRTLRGPRRPGRACSASRLTQHWHKRRLIDLVRPARPPRDRRPDGAAPPDPRARSQPDEHLRRRQPAPRRASPRSRPASPSSSSAKITNVDRTAGARVSHALVGKHGPDGLPDDTIAVTLTGSAGPELRRLARPGRHARPRGRGQRLRGQGPVRRHPLRPPARDASTFMTPRTT